MNALSYKISGVLAASLLAATAVSAQVTEPATPNAVPDQVPAITDPAGPPTSVTTPSTTPTPQMAMEAVTDTSARDFIREAFLANEFSVAAAQLALKNAESEDVKAVAQQIINDGQAIRTNLIAAVQGATSDVQFDQSWTEEHKAQLAELTDLSGAQFDARYIELQSEVTSEASTEFSDYAQNGTDEAVKTFATTTQPMLAAQADALNSAAQGGN